jgi:hypothetical protein
MRQDATDANVGYRKKCKQTCKNIEKSCWNPLAAVRTAWLMCVIGKRFFIHHNGDKNMNLDTLIEILNDYREELGGDAEVRLMTQQNWPFENRICGVTSGQEMNDTNDDDEADDDQDVADENIVYIVEGGQICYGSKRAWETCRNS